MNYDAPAAFDLRAFRDRLEALRQGKGVPRRRYDFRTGAVTVGGAVGPAEVVIAEGLLALGLLGIVEEADLLILLEGDDDRLLERRIRRDGAERAYSEEEVRVRFREDVLPAQRRFLEGAERIAHLIFPMDWNKGHVVRAAARIGERIRPLAPPEGDTSRPPCDLPVANPPVRETAAGRRKDRPQ